MAKDESLRNAVRAHGRAWIEITERYFPERTPTCVRNRLARVPCHRKYVNLKPRRYDHLTKTADKALTAASPARQEELAFPSGGSVSHRVPRNGAFAPGCNTGISEGYRHDEVTDHLIGQRTRSDSMNLGDAAATLISGSSSLPSSSLPHQYKS